MFFKFHQDFPPHGNSFLKWQQLWYVWHFSPLYIKVFSPVPNIALVESSANTAF
jgi:hypothetical protein